MMKIVLVLFFASLTLSYGIKVDNFIIGGTEVNPNQYPFAVALFARTTTGTIRTRICGASLISRQAILTAATCVHNHENITVTLGAHNLNNAEPFQVWLPITDVNVHPDYERGQLHNDIAVLRLQNPIGFFNQAVQIIALPDPGNQFLSTNGNVVGWGCTTSLPGPANCPVALHLRTATVTTQVDTQCNAIPPYQMCAGGGVFSGTACHGDEGSPFFTTINGNFVLIGLVQGAPTLCQNSMTLTRITSFLSWIRPLM